MKQFDNGSFVCYFPIYFVCCSRFIKHGDEHLSCVCSLLLISFHNKSQAFIRTDERRKKKKKKKKKETEIIIVRYFQLKCECMCLF